MSCGRQNIYCFLFGARLACWQLNCQTRNRMIKPVYLAKQYRNSAKDSHYSSRARSICRGTKETSEDTNTASNPQTPRIRYQLVCQLDRSSLPPHRVWEYTSTSAGLRAPASESEMTSSAQVLIPAPADYNSRQPTMVKLRDPTCSQLNGQITWPRVFAVKWSNYVTSCIRS